MADIVPNIVVSMPAQQFTLARSFKAASNGKIYIGKIDTDPVNSENQIQVYIEGEGGSYVPVAQPIVINAGGYPVYSGQIAKFVTVEGHSMAIYDASGEQQFYFPNVLKYDPDQLNSILAGSGGAGIIGTENGDSVQDSLDHIKASIYQDPIAKWPLGGTLKIKQGVYDVNSPLVMDYGLYPAEFIGKPGYRLNYRGENMAETIFNCNVDNDFNIKMIGDSTFATQRVAAYDYIGGFTLNGSNTSYGMHVDSKAYSKIQDVVIYGHENGEGLRFTNFLTSELDNIYLQNNNIGLRILASDAGSEFNAIAISRLTVSNNKKLGMLADRWGAGSTINGLTCEGNGEQGKSGYGGMQLAVNGLNGSAALVMNNPYFEGNAGDFDLSIDNTGALPITVVINGGNFHRVSANRYTNTNIQATSSGGGLVSIILIGTTFQSTSGYSPSEDRPFWRTGNNCEIVDISCQYNETISRAGAASMRSLPSVGRILSNGNVDYGFGFEINIVSDGVYSVNNHQPLGRDPGSYIVTASPYLAPDNYSISVNNVSTTEFRVTIRDRNGIGVNCGFNFMLSKVI